MKSAVARSFAAVLGLAVLLVAGPDASAQQLKLRASGSFPAGHTGSIAMEVFKSEVARLTKGAVAVELFPGNVLGGAFEQVDQVRTGQIHMSWAGPSFYDRLVPEFNAATLPFAASTASQAFCQIDSELGTFLAERASEKGVLVLGWGSNGFRHITNNKRPIKKVDDLKGLKIRTPSGEIFSLAFRAVGANPTPIDIKELYQALQQGVVDGQENPYDNMWVRKFHEVQKYLSNSGHFYDWVAYFMHKPTFDALKPDQQKAVREAMFTAVSYQRALAERENNEALGKLVKGGMKYDELSKEELGKFREAVRPVWDRIRERIGSKAVDLAVKAVKECS
ncbi:MAG TPA: TRAP transporter substrate-binding protein [Methylomirabilota bacterium]|jgi:tripartite ATP-independent transporter DctP family solute receptor|nr:TRAP transporter substrate-binding protein [Methylomirabilota bacterium]